MKRLSLLLLGALLLLGGVSMRALGAASVSGSEQPSALWQPVAELDVAATGERRIQPSAYGLYRSDLAALRAALAAAPMERSGDAPLRFALPMPDGTLASFDVTEYSMMEAELAAKFPTIRTFWALGVDDTTARARLDVTDAGFHAMVWGRDGIAAIDPYQTGDTEHYISYWKHDLDGGHDHPEIGVVEGEPLSDAEKAFFEQESVSTGEQLRSYRLAMAATGEYTIFHGGTVPLAMAAIVTSMNRVNGVYEIDVSVRMVLVANNNLIVYTNPATDPYTNNSGGTMLGQNQANLDLVIGTANYDIGHVFSTGGGGVASLRSVCSVTNKARGVTGSPSPVGDPFDIDYVAHEIGHQYGGNHTFNGTTSSCGGGNRSASTAYEPGSGSTIMAYAGICGAENLQPNSDALFHVGSLVEIVAFTQTGNGNSCAQITSTGNLPPVPNAGPDYNIPAQTPFELVGSAVDPNGNTLSYIWEQFDVGTAAPPNTDNGNRAIFRSFVPTSSPARTLPKLSDILNNTSTLGEALPTTTRNLTFRLTARDGLGGTAWDTVEIESTNAAGPFQVTSNNTASGWQPGSAQTITWNVANTTAAPVSCPTVDILFSSNGGTSFDTVLAAATPNDGSQQITAPTGSTTTGRVKVKCSTGIFFDINNASITISGSITPTVTPSITATPSPTLSPTITATVAPTHTATATSVPSGYVMYLPLVLK